MRVQISTPLFGVMYVFLVASSLLVAQGRAEVGEIVEATRQALDAEIAFVTGGFHLLPYPRHYVADLARSMKNDLGVKTVGATHCTGDEAIEVFKQTFGENALWAGLGARITLSE